MNSILIISFLVLFKTAHSFEGLDSSLNLEHNGDHNSKRIFKRSPFFNTLAQYLGAGNSDITSETVEDTVKFYLYYDRENPENRQEIITNNITSLKISKWVPGLPTKIFIHGYVSNLEVPQMVEIRNKLIERNDNINIIGLKWEEVSGLFYTNAAHYTEDVGKAGAKFIDFLCENGAKPSDFHLMGLSLGAHVAGFVGKHVKTGKIGRISGFDPAYPGFITVDPEDRLHKSQAEYVDCIITCGGSIGIMEPDCHANFYINNGVHPQPGCPSNMKGMRCSHVRAQDIFTESIERNHKFPALTCEKFGPKGPKNCKHEGAVMGYPVPSRFRGIFLVETNTEYPFAMI